MLVPNHGRFAEHHRSSTATGRLPKSGNRLPHSIHFISPPSLPLFISETNRDAKHNRSNPWPVVANVVANVVDREQRALRGANAS